MGGETNLDNLIKLLDAKLNDGLYAFVTVQPDKIPAHLNPRMIFQEAEGTTLIVLESEATTHALSYEFPCRMITLNIHSSLAAVGFMARIATALAKHGMGVNPVSGFFHDYLFVPDGREQDVLAVLRDFASA